VVDTFLHAEDQELAAHRHALEACHAPGACHAYERERERGRMVKNVCCRTIEREQDIRMSRREEHEIFLLRSGRAFSTSLLKRMEENALSVCA
jgi:hypothetical protein